MAGQLQCFGRYVAAVQLIADMTARVVGCMAPALSLSSIKHPAKLGPLGAGYCVAHGVLSRCEAAGSNHGPHGGVEFLARIGVDPRLIRVRRRRTGVDVTPDLSVDPEAGEERPEHHFVGLRISRRQKIGDVMMTCRGERRAGENLRRDAVLREE